MNVAFIPVRGGSKSIPLKNIKKIAGYPLVYWTIKAACECNKIDYVYISTDSEQIKLEVQKFPFNKIQVISRSAETANDTASTESAMMEFASKYEFDNIALIQATSPLLTSSDLVKGFQILESNNVDSVISVVKQKRFLWESDSLGNANALNYNIYSRPRRQDFDGFYVENGAFYLTSKELLIRSRNRISGNIHLCEMDESTYFEIDELSDWVIMEQLLKLRLENDGTNIQNYYNIKLVATDCDGVLTDGGMYYTKYGDSIKKFNTLDGMGIEILKKYNIKTAIITGENNSLVRIRGEKLGIDDIILGQKDKKAALFSLCTKYHLDISEIAYIGDDIFDIPAIQICGFGCAPCTAQDIVKSSAKYVTSKGAGQGCFREIVDMICGTKITL